MTPWRRVHNVLGLEGAAAGQQQRDGLWLEVQFDFLGTAVRLLSANVGHLQHWCAVYSEFRVNHREPDVTIRVSDQASKVTPRGVTIETAESATLWDGRAPLMPPLRAEGLNHYIYLQAAATGRSGHAVLIVGGRRTGKTTLAAAATARGARLLADDLVPLDPTDLLALPWPKSLALPPEVLSELGVHMSTPGLVPFFTRSGELRFRVPPSALFGKQVARTPAEVAAIVFLESPDEGPAGLREIHAGEAFERLVRHLELRPEDRELTADALVRLCRRTPSYALRVSTSADDAATLDALTR
jgi:hypothetical protein